MDWASFFPVNWNRTIRYLNFSIFFQQFKNSKISLFRYKFINSKIQKFKNFVCHIVRNHVKLSRSPSIVITRNFFEIFWKWLSETRSRGGGGSAGQFFFWKTTETWNFAFGARKPTPPGPGRNLVSHDQDAADLRPAAWPGLRLSKFRPGPGVSAKRNVDKIWENYWQSVDKLLTKSGILSFDSDLNVNGLGFLFSKWTGLNKQTKNYRSVFGKKSREKQWQLERN